MRRINELARDSGLSPRGSPEEHAAQLGFHVVDADYGGPLTGNQITPKEYEAMVREAAKPHQWNVLDAAQYAIESRLLGLPSEKQSIHKYKDDWVKDYKTTINVIARRYGIPPEVLAGVASIEVGGDPDKQDMITHWARTRGKENFSAEARRTFAKSAAGFGRPGRFVAKFADDPEKTSAGDVSIQVRRVAETEGIDPRTLSEEQRRAIIDRLRVQSYNLDVVARHMRDLLDTAYPGRRGTDLDDAQFQYLRYMYNLGYPHPAIDVSKPVPERIGNSRYGPDLLKRIPRMRRLLQHGG